MMFIVLEVLFLLCVPRILFGKDHNDSEVALISFLNPNIAHPVSSSISMWYFLILSWEVFISHDGWREPESDRPHRHTEENLRYAELIIK